MNEKTLSQLVYSDFDLKNITVYDSVFRSGNEINFLTKGRTKNVLHFITFGTREYEINGRTFRVSEGTVIFIPDGTKYCTRIPSSETDCRGIGICFDMTQSEFGKIFIAPDIYCDWSNTRGAVDYFKLMEQLYSCSSVSVLSLKITLFKLINMLCSSDINSSRNNAFIKPALSFISEHYNENLPVKVYAEKCNLSESHFRKKFSECTGMSPIEYRNKIRLNEAERMVQKNYSLQEIAEKVGFNDAAYLSKIYKRKTGLNLTNNAEII